MNAPGDRRDLHDSQLVIDGCHVLRLDFEEPTAFSLEVSHFILISCRCESDPKKAECFSGLESFRCCG
jgi:hypothetical protein